MYFSIFLCLLASSLGAPNLQGYNFPTPSDDGGLISGTDNSFRNVDSGSINGGNLDITTGGVSPSLCGNCQVLSSDGSCTEAEVERKIFVFRAPEQTSERQINPITPPKPKLNYNIVFVRTPEGPEGYEPVVVPPAQQKTLVYVLNKEGDDSGPQVIEMPDIQPHAPEVFYINYREGDNPQLPFGVDLQTALASAITEQGQLLFGGGSARFGSDIETSSGGGFGGAISGGFIGAVSEGFGDAASGGFRDTTSGGFRAEVSGGLGGSVLGGSTSVEFGGSGEDASGNLGFGSSVSGGSSNVVIGGSGGNGLGNGGVIYSRVIPSEYTPPNPSNLYGTPP